jgi:nitroreductase
MSEDNDIPSHHGVDTETTGEYPNSTIKILMERGSCRAFSDKKIPPHVVQTLLETGIHAATGGNLQPYSIIKVEDKKTAEELAIICERQRFIGKAPLNLLFCLDHHRLQRWAKLAKAPFGATSSFRHFWISFQDILIAAQSICTAADAMGLGSVYIGSTLECMRRLREMFELPDGVIPIVLLSVGYPKQQPKVKRKLPPSVVVHDEKYREMSDEELLAAFDAKYPGLKIAITEERLEQFSETCRHLHGSHYAEECLALVKKQGYFNPVQRYFGLHYCADWMVQDNEEFVKILKEYGFNILRNVPFVER